MSQVLFYAVTAAQYAALSTKDDNALYFVTDANRLYKGSVPFAHPVQTVASFPASGEKGTVYVKTGTCEAKTWDGSAWVTVGLPAVTALAETAGDGELPTARAVKQYVDGKISTVNGDVANVIAGVSYSSASKSISVSKGTGSPVTTQLKGLVDGASYNGSTGVLTLTTNGGTPVTVNLPVENFLSAASFDHATNVLTLTLTGGETVTVNLTDLVDVYTGASGSTATVTISDSGQVSAAVNVSQAAGNILQAKQDGLYASIEWQVIG